MHPLLDKYLCEKYPKIFVNRNKSPQETCMCWGLDVGDGWFYLVDELCRQIQRWVDNPVWVEKKDLKTRLGKLWNYTIWNWFIYPLVKDLPMEEYQRYSDHWMYDGDLYEKPPFNQNRQVVADQVKEKFSGLRIYYHGGSDYVRGLVSMAESLSYCICENCGKMDKNIVATAGWITTTCPEHVCESRVTVPRNSNDKKLARIWKRIENEKKLKQLTRK